MLFHKGKGFFQIVNHFRLIDVGEHTELAAVFGNLFAEDEDEVDHPCFDRQDTAEAARLVENAQLLNDVHHFVPNLGRPAGADTRHRLQLLLDFALDTSVGVGVLEHVQIEHDDRPSMILRTEIEVNIAAHRDADIPFMQIEYPIVYHHLGIALQGINQFHFLMPMAGNHGIAVIIKEHIWYGFLRRV